MKNKTISVKRSLISSVISLFLCISMLMGTTYAWFTDSVTSANNVISSGNLDILLEYWDGTSWKNVQGSSEIFEKNALWEPGYTQMVYLKISNTGSLALRYLLGVNIASEINGVNDAGEEFKLSDYIYFATETSGSFEEISDRSDALAVSGASKRISEGFQKSGYLAPDSEPVYVTMVVYMPDTGSNDACHNGVNVPRIDIGINIIATQFMGESDSFDDQYDKDSGFGEGDSDGADGTTSGFMHISFDDVTYSFSNLSTKNYSSLYDEPFFAWLKSLHESYGAKFSLYVYDGALDSVPDTYASEFQAASDWLKIGIHDGGNGIYNSFASTSYSMAQNYWNDFVDQVKRITGGTDNIDRVPRLHYFAASKEALMGMKEAECGALGFISADDDRISYYFNSEIRDYLYDNDHITDLSNGLVFLSTDMRGDWFNSGFSTANNYKAPSYGNVYDELVYRFSTEEYYTACESFIFFAHEWQFYNGSSLNGNKIWTEDACRFAAENGIAFDYAQNRTFTSTPYDITSAQGPIETVATFDGETLNIVDDFGSVNYVGGYTINGSGLKYTVLAPRAVSKTEILRVSEDKRKLSLDLTKLSIKDKLYYTVYLFSDLPLNSSTYQDLGGKSGTWMQEDIIIPSDAKYIMILFKNGNDEAFSHEDLALLNQCVSFEEPEVSTSVKYYNTELQIVDSIEQMVFDPEYSMPGNAGADFSKTTLDGRACCVTAVLAVEGGETIELIDNLKDVFGSEDLYWALIEFKDAPLSKSSMSTTSNAATGRAWLSGSHTLNENTRYVILAFRHGDGSIDFTEEQLAVLSKCLQVSSAVE